MLIKFSDEYLKYTNGLSELVVAGRTLGACLDKMFQLYPQLYVHWMDNQAEEGFKSSFYLNGEFIWESESVDIEVGDPDTLVVRKDIPSGSGAIGKIIAGVVLIIVAVVIAVLSMGSGTFVSGLMANYAIGMMVGMMGVSMVISGVAELIIGTPSMPSFGDYGSSGSNTPTYSFSGIRNTTTVGTPLGLVYGTHRVGGQLLNVYTDLEGTDTYLYAQLGLCEGEITGISDVEINKNPLNFYTDVVTDYRLGASTQEVMGWFTRTENSVSVGSLINASGADYETSKIVDAVKIIVAAPSIYYSGTSGLQPTSVNYSIYYKLDTNPGYTLYGAFDMSGQSKSEIALEYLLSLPAPGTYQLKVIRNTEDHSGSLNYADAIYLKTVNEINYDQFSYPCTAMLGLKVKATEQLSGGMPTITSVVRGQKIYVPNNYNPDTHTYSSVTWDGTFAASKQWSDNPVWCLYDLLTNKRYGLGDYYRLDADKIAIIKAQFYLMARYCDELVNGIPRYTLNIVIDSSKSASEWVGIITATMQAVLYYSEGMLWIDINRPKPITQLFNMSNIIDGTYTQSGTSYKKVSNVYDVQWPNPDRHYEYSMFRLEHMDLQAADIVVEERKAAMNMVGVTRYQHVRRLAKYALLTGRTNQKTVSFKTASNGLQCMVTDVIGIQHDVPQWGYGARVADYNADTRELTLSNDLVVAAGSIYEIKIAHRGQEPLTYSMSAAEGTTRSVTLGEVPDPTPERGDIYIIGETDYSVKPFRVLSLKINEDSQLEVVAVEYNASVYTAAEDLTDQSEVLVHSYTSLESPSRLSVLDFTAAERIYLANDGTVKTGIECFFSPQNTSLFWDSACIYYGVDGTNSYQVTLANKTGSLFIPDLQEHTVYKLVACSLYKDGTRQSMSQALADSVAAPFATVTLLGKTAPPLNVTNFTATQNINNNNYIKFSWAPTGDVDLSHYEIRKGSSWELGEIIKDYIKETYYNEVFIQASGDYEFMVKAVDTSGNYSEVPAVASISAQVEPQVVSGLQAKQIGSTVLISWNANAELDILGYTVREGSSWEASMVIVENTPNTNHTMSGVTNRTFMFWVKAVDIYGNESIFAANAACNAVNVPLANIYVTYDESGDGWPGVKSGVTTDSGHLSLPAVYTYDSGITYDSTTVYDFFALGTGTYSTLEYDLGHLMNVNVLFDYALTIGAGDVFKIEIATSDGNTLTWDDNVMWDVAPEWDSAYLFSDWAPFTGGFITARVFKLRMTLVNYSGLLSVDTFKTYVDVPDVTQRDSNVAVPAEGTTITFTYPFFVPPTVSLTCTGVGYPRIISKSNTNFEVQVYNSSDVAIAGVIDWVATGY